LGSVPRFRSILTVMRRKQLRSRDTITDEADQLLYLHRSIDLYPCYSVAVEYNGFAREDACVDIGLSRPPACPLFEAQQHGLRSLDLDRWARKPVLDNLATRLGVIGLVALTAPGAETRPCEVSASTNQLHPRKTALTVRWSRWRQGPTIASLTPWLWTGS
jgi:hypothetical protein